MGTPMNLPELLTALTDSLESSSSSLPESTAIAPPADGISLLDAKNELLLSYLQNLVFLIILKLRDFREGKGNGDKEPSAEHADVTKKLVELRVYLEKGIRPLESKLQYQLDKLLHMTNEADAAALNEPKDKRTTHTKSTTNGHRADSSPSDSDSDARSSRSASASPLPAPAISDLSHRPNLSAFTTRPLSAPTKATKNPRDRPSTTTTTTAPYRPPRINPTALPTTTTTTSNNQKADNKATRTRKSHMLDDFIREELTDAPLAQPSIGAGSRLRGREKAAADERREYEESRLVRLPGNAAAAAGADGGKKKGTKKRGGRGLEFGDDGRGDLEGGWGGVAGVDFRGAKRRKGTGEGKGVGGERKRVGEDWERRVRKGKKKGRRV